MEQPRHRPQLRHALGRRQARSLIARLVAKGDNLLAFPLSRVTINEGAVRPGVQATVVSFSRRRS